MSREVLMLPKQLDIAAVTALHQTILQLSGRDADVILEGCEVETITTPCLQILIAAGRDSARIKVRGASPAVLAAARDLGVLAALPLIQGDEESA